MADNSSVTITPGVNSSYATAIRGCVNEALAYNRTGLVEDMEDAIKRLRLNVTRLESALRSSVKEA